MKKIILYSLLITLITGCKITNEKELAFSIEVANKDCVPVSLAVYKNNTYELFTSYLACPPNQTCNSMLTYTKSKLGKYDYDINKIIENSTDANDLTYSMDNLPEYELYVGNEYRYYTVEKGQTNIYLNEFLDMLNINLNTCAKKDYNN